MPSAELVDTDIHPMMLERSLDERLSERWRQRYRDFGVRIAPPPAIYPRVRNSGYRVDAWPEGGFPGSDLDLLRRQLLDEHDVRYGLLNPLQGQVWGADSPDLAAVLCGALNDWILEEWLEPEPRLLGSVCVPFEHPDLAVREIERCAGDARFAHVLLPASAESPLGNRRYWPIYEAAAIEAGFRSRSTPPASSSTAAPAGRRTTSRSTSGNAQRDGRQIDQHGLRGRLRGVPRAAGRAPGGRRQLGGGADVGGSTRSWGVLRERGAAPDATAVRVLPRALLVHHPADRGARGTRGPRRAPSSTSAWATACMFATDYPHWDFDAPKQALPRALGEQLRTAILAGNACALYDLPRDD